VPSYRRAHHVDNRVSLLHHVRLSAIVLPIFLHPPKENADDELGSVTPGKFADLVAVPGNPLDDISVMSKVSFVMKAGVVYKRDSQEVLTLE